MRWLTFLILAVLTVSLQSTIAPRLAWGGATPDWVLVLVVCYGLHAKSDQAIVAGWVAGVLADLMTIERFGLLSLSYGLVAAAVCGVRSLVFTSHPLTHFCVTGVAALLVRFGWSAYRAATGLPVEPVWELGWACVYTAVWAPPVHWVLLKMPRVLGFRPPHHRPGRVAPMRGPRV